MNAEQRNEHIQAMREHDAIGKLPKDKPFEGQEKHKNAQETLLLALIENAKTPASKNPPLETLIDLATSMETLQTMYEKLSPPEPNGAQRDMKAMISYIDEHQLGQQGDAKTTTNTEQLGTWANLAKISSNTLASDTQR